MDLDLWFLYRTISIKEVKIRDFYRTFKETHLLYGNNLYLGYFDLIINIKGY